MKDMFNAGYINREIDNKSKLKLKPTWYYLTDKARTLLQMNILKMDYKQKIFKQIYENILMMPDFFERVYQKILINDPIDEMAEKIPMSERIVKQITIDSDREFDKFLTNLSLCRNDWIGYVSFRHSSEIGKIIYPNGISSKQIYQLKQKYLKRIRNGKKLEETLLLLCHPIIESEDDLDFWARRIEKWTIRKKGKKDLFTKLTSRVYHLFIPGVSIEEISKDGIFLDEDLLEATNILKESRLIKMKPFGKEFRYILADGHLHDFIAIKSTFVLELDFLLYKWMHFESPTLEEANRMGSIFNSKKFKRLSTQLEIKLSQHRKKMRVCKNVDE